MVHQAVRAEWPRHSCMVQLCWRARRPCSWCSAPAAQLGYCSGMRHQIGSCKKRGRGGGTAPLLQCSCLIACNRDAPAGCRLQPGAGRSSCTGSMSDCTNGCDQRWSSPPAGGRTRLSTSTQEPRGKTFAECLGKPLPERCETLLLHPPGRAGKDLQQAKGQSQQCCCVGGSQHC